MKLVCNISSLTRVFLLSQTKGCAIFNFMIEIMFAFKFVNDVFHVLGESNSDKVQKFKRWFWFIVEKMSLQERQDLVRHCVYYTAIVLFWLPILLKFGHATHTCTYTFFFYPFFHANKCVCKTLRECINGRLWLDSWVWGHWHDLVAIP